MSIVAITGDVATTTAVALAAGWLRDDDLVLVEADKRGGDLAAWFDLSAAPSLSTAVTNVRNGGWSDLERHTRLAPVGLRVLTAPARVVEAEQAVNESAHVLVPMLASQRSPVTVADVGRPTADTARNPFLEAASAVVVVHRQSPQSARAAGVRLRRLADQLPSMMSSAASPIVAVVGHSPFDAAEVAAFLDDEVGRHTVVSLPIDDLAAHVIAGRSGVSERRLARLPLMRAARDLSALLRDSLARQADGPWRTAR